MNYTKQKAQEGDQEAQTIYEQIELEREMDQLEHDLDGNGEPANELQSNGGDASMHDAAKSRKRKSRLVARRMSQTGTQKPASASALHSSTVSTRSELQEEPQG
eukprot:1144285-Amphidinium_carterae.1